MILSVISLLIVVLLTMYMATQGFLTSLLLLISAMFASVLAMGVYESLAPLVGSFRPDYAAGVAFLGVFLIALVVIRIVTDFVVPKNVKLNMWIDRAGGGAIGIVASLFIIGTAVIGFEMLPLPESIGGTPRIENDHLPGSKNHTMSANMVMGFYGLASGKAMGGLDLEANHPDLAAELVGYRHTVALGARTSLDPQFITADFWYTVTPDKSKALKIESTGLNPSTIIVRTEIARGSDQPKASYDTTDKGQVLMLTPTQVRLVTANEKGVARQYYPIGILDHGRTFQALPLATGYTIDDYVGDKAVDEWVFEIADGQIPKFIEIKRGGRVSLADKEVKTPPAALASTAYPPHQWLVGAADLHVAVKLNGTPVSGALVLRMTPDTTKGQVTGLINAVGDAIGSNTAGSDYTTLIHMKNADNKDLVNWRDLLRMAVDAKIKSGSTITSTWEYIQGDLKKAIAQTDSIKSESLTDLQGEAEAKNVAKGDYILVVAAHNEDVLRFWIRELKWDPNDKSSGQGPDLHEAFDEGAVVELRAPGK